METVLFSSPTHDDNVSYLHHYVKELIQYAKNNNWKVLKRKGKDANKKIITSLINKQKPKFIMFNGHGSPICICGHNDEIIVSNKNPELLKDAVTYALACSSAADLGEKTVQKGAISFIGYIDDFALGKDPDSEATPARDKIAALFLQPSNELVKFILRGNSIKRAVSVAKKKMLDNFWYLNTTNDFPEAPYYAPYLFNNYACLKPLGDESFSF